MKRNIINTLGLLLYLLTCLVSCKSDENDSSGPDDHDPSKPVLFDSFAPLEGRIREKIVIKGANFGNDPSKIQVIFSDEILDRKATIIGLANEAIYCLAPRQLEGLNKIKIVINEKDTIEHSGVFNYQVTELVTTLVLDASGKTDEGTLATANFKFSSGIAYIGDESVLVFDTELSRVRLVSIPDNRVINVHVGVRGCHPAITADRSRVYAVTTYAPHTVYMYTRDSGWAPSRIGELGTLSGLPGNYIGSVTFADDEEWLYFASAMGVFGRFNVLTQETEVLKEDMNIPRDYSTFSGYWEDEKVNFLLYHPDQNCFYLSVKPAYSLYKVDMEGNAEHFAGMQNRSAITDGYLENCTFVMPNGMTLDADGNIYLCDGSRAAGHCIRKITFSTGYVSTVAGRAVSGLPALTALVDGDEPLLAMFRLPTNIVYDGEGAFYILDGWGRRLRKYAVE